MKNLSEIRFSRPETLNSARNAVRETIGEVGRMARRGYGEVVLASVAAAPVLGPGGETIPARPLAFVGGLALLATTRRDDDDRAKFVRIVVGAGATLWGISGL
jgi:hypothetical protein